MEERERITCQKAEEGLAELGRLDVDSRYKAEGERNGTQVLPLGSIMRRQHLRVSLEIRKLLPRPDRNPEACVGYENI